MNTSMEKALEAIHFLNWEGVVVDLEKGLAICRRPHDPLRDMPLDKSYSTNRLLLGEDGNYYLVSGVYDMTLAGAQESYLERLPESW